MTDRVRRAAIGVAATLALLALVALGSGTSVFDRDSRSVAMPSLSSVTDVILIGAAGFVALLVIGVLIAALTSGSPDAMRKKKKRSWWIYLALIAALFLLIQAIDLPESDEPQAAPIGEVQAEEPVESETAAASVDQTTVAIVAAVLAVIGIALAVVARRAAPALDAETDLVEARTAVASSLTSTIDDIRAEPDPRRAILLAEERLEATLREHGLGREPWETSLEHLERSLPALQAAAEPAVRLHQLFELAMYSTEPLERAHQLEAIAAFEAIRDDVAQVISA